MQVVLDMGRKVCAERMRRPFIRQDERSTFEWPFLAGAIAVQDQLIGEFREFLCHGGKD